MKRPIRSLPTAMVVVATALAASACSGGSEGSDDEEDRRRDGRSTVVDASGDASPPTDAASATSNATDGTAPNGRPSAMDRETTTTRQAGQATTTETLIPRMPLLGFVLAEGETAPDRPALVVKVDNAAAAYPQSGLNEADIVFEEIVEFGITRFAVVYHSQSASPVGPIRSGRTQDVDLLAGFNYPLFAWSGGNPGVTDAIANSDLVNLNAQHTPGYFRTDDRSPPHNLYAETDDLWALAPEDAPNPTPMFQYLDPGEQVGGKGVDHDDAASASMSVGSLRVRWDWSSESGAYLRSQNGSSHDTASTGRVSTDNVVVLEMQYVPSRVDARSPEAVTIGEGQAWVLSRGKVIAGHWERNDRTSEFRLVQDVGGDATPIKLTPGRTFVELIDRTAPDPIVDTA